MAISCAGELSSNSFHSFQDFLVGPRLVPEQSLKRGGLVHVFFPRSSAKRRSVLHLTSIRQNTSDHSYCILVFEALPARKSIDNIMTSRHLFSISLTFHAPAEATARIPSRTRTIARASTRLPTLLSSSPGRRRCLLGGIGMSGLHSQGKSAAIFAYVATHRARKLAGDPSDAPSGNRTG